MSDWVYVAGEGGFNQDFQLINQSTGVPLDLTGATITMFISDSSFTTNYPADGDGTTMAAAVDDNGDDVARLVVSTTFMPQAEGTYMGQVKFVSTATVRSFLINLRVIRLVGNP